jgi:molecular chaperone GrpE
MEVVAAIGWILGLAALAAVGWGQQKLSELQAVIERTAQEAGGYKKQLVEALQEGNAALRRVKDQAQSEKRFAHEPVVKDLLEVVDSFERALDTLPEGPDAEGIRMIHQQLLAVLARHGVERVPAKGATFDPVVHEAISTQVSAEHEEHTVIEEWAGGYRLHERVLRAAKVVLAVPGPGDDDVVLDDDAAPDGVGDGGEE